MNRPKVSISRCSDYDPATVRAALKMALEPLGGFGSFVKPGQQVLLKPNFIMPRPLEEPAITHPVVLQELALQALEIGAKVSIADSPAWGTTETIARETGLWDFANQHNISLFDLDQSTRIALPAGCATRHLVIDKRVLDADVVINVPKAKVHCQLTMSGAVKNLFGCVSGRRKAFWHFRLGRKPEHFVALLLDIVNTIRPSLTIVDAVEAMDRHGPTGGDPLPLGLLMAGEDCMAVDCVLAELMGIDPEKVLTLQVAKQKGELGTSLEQVEIQGEPVSVVRQQFTLPEMEPILFSLPRIIKGLIKQKILRPLLGR